MDPICFRIGSFAIHWFGVMMALGFSAALGTWVWVGRKEGRNTAFCTDLLFWTMAAGILGARAAYVISDWRHYMENPGLIFRLDKGGLIFYGGVIAAIVAIIVFARSRRTKPIQVFDFVAFVLPLAHAFGRIGCFMNGCCHGILSYTSLAVRYPDSSLPWYQHRALHLIPYESSFSLPVHPVQLYETAYNLLIFAVLLWFYKRRRLDGTTTAAYLLLYPAGRFTLEILRGDDRMGVGGLNMAQMISVGLFLAGLILLAIVSIRARHSPPTPENGGTRQPTASGNS